MAAREEYLVAGVPESKRIVDGMAQEASEIRVPVAAGAYGRRHLSGIMGRGALNSLSLALGVVAVVLHILGERLELGFLKQFTKRAITVPTRGEKRTVVHAQVLDLCRRMLVLDLSAFLTGATVESRVFGGVTHKKFLPFERTVFRSFAVAFSVCVKNQRWVGAGLTGCDKTHALCQGTALAGP
jgi:hypothetical protein